MSYFSKKFSFTALALSLIFLLSSVAFPPSLGMEKPFYLAALAEDDKDEEGVENEEEDEDEENEDEEETTSKPKTETIKVLKEVIEYKPVLKTVIVTEEAYSKDTDNDALVDGIDPDPLVPQSEYFTDIDNDGVPNAIDRHHDEDDFAYYEFETDDNNNGILDSYEQ